MMAKIVKGTSFAGCVKYVLNEEKAKLLFSENLPNGNHTQIANDFELQAMLNPKVKNKVGHISLSFALQDKAMANDDELMAQIATEYLTLMNIRDTQYIIARHTDQKHRHCHIVYNRVDNNGKTISDKNDRFRSEKICKLLTAKHRLHFSKGKEQVNTSRLRPKDAKKYHIYNVAMMARAKSQSWQEFTLTMEQNGVKIDYKNGRGSGKPEGIQFSYDGCTFSGSKVDRKLSYGNLNSYFDYTHNTLHKLDMGYNGSQEATPQEPEQSVVESVASGLLSILSPLSDGDSDYDEDENATQMAQQQKLKKKPKRRGFRM